MALSPSLQLRQSQSLVMTPQLQQAIKLLQLSNMELAAYVEQQIEQNPLLDRSEGGDDETGATESEVPATEFADSAAALSEDGSLDAKANDLDTEYDNVWEPSGAFEGYGQAGSGGFDGEAFDLEQNLGETPTLREHLVRQLELDFEDPVDRLVGIDLIDQLDEAGYMRADLDAVAEGLGADRPRVERVLSRMQGFDPSGVFARDLAECLALQLRDRNRLDPLIQAVLDNLDLVARHDWQGLRECTGIDDEDLADALAEIRALQPRPAEGFDHRPVETVVPDVLMRRTPEGDWAVELNPDALPRVLVDRQYYARVRAGARGREEREYVAEQYQAASWLEKSLDQRANTILKVASEIARQQDAFFVHGVQHLRPLTLRDVADAIGMHESTVSRVTTAKYLASPRGLFELKYFFTSAIASASGGQAHSAEAVRHRIKVMIDREPPSGVLSDDRIVELLRGDGIDIARRTVAKYREAMRIPSSVQRRREKAAPVVVGT